MDESVITVIGETRLLYFGGKKGRRWVAKNALLHESMGRDQEAEREREMVGWAGPLQVTIDPYFLLNNLFIDDAAICVRLNQLMTS